MTNTHTTAIKTLPTMWSSNFQFSDLFYITVGWIASFHLAGVVTLPCGYNDETCPTEGAYASNPADCTRYYRCNHGKWLLLNCSEASPGGCGTPVAYCRRVTCLETITAVIRTTRQGHGNTRRGTSARSNTNVPGGTTKRRPTTARQTTRGNRLTSESAVASTSASTEGSTVIEKFTKDSAVTIKTTPLKDTPDKSQTTMQIIPQGGKTMAHEGGPSEGGVIAGAVMAVLLVLVILILGLLWWKRRDMLLNFFNKGKGKNSTNEYDAPYVYQDPHGLKSTKENPTKNNNESSVHIYCEPIKTSPKPTYNGDQSPVIMRNNTLYSAGTDEPFYNTADDPKYDAADSHDYTYTQPPGFKSDTKENHYYTTPGKADDVYYSTVAKEVDGANEQDRRRNGDPSQNSIPQYADVIPRSKRASDPNVADDIDDYCLAREPNSTNQQEPYYFVLENPADTAHYQNTN